MKRRLMAPASVLAAAALVLSACSGGDSSTSTSSDAGSDTGNDAASGEAVTLTLAGWSLATTPEFEALADGFMAANPNITIDVEDYDVNNYETQITADLAAGVAPDIYTVKQLMTFPTFQEGGQLMDVSDVAAEISPDVATLEHYEVDGITYAVPYRADAWYLYYNADLFETAGVEIPDGQWTWEDFDQAASDVTAGLAAAGNTDALGNYQHSWASTVQGFANAQGQGDGEFLEAEWDYMVPFYEEALARQAEGSQVDFGAITTNSLTYQGQFGTQKAAMMVMGSWYVATYLSQVESGDAESFSWGFAPVPQQTTETAENPVTFGSPTAMGINPAIDESKVSAAKAFLTYIASEDAAIALAEIGITPALTNDAVADAMFAKDGMPTDDLSRFAFTTHQTALEVPLGTDSPGLQTVLGDAHTAIMSGSVSPQDGIAEAMERAKSEVLD
ncbi:carbohydrate ABC transporter substrate-binding protein (CUT1 family) [Serinibacter salmoneus]|uniref:Carbohydrate ABC transporter substrate-binding protein (CUT1 family) n=2 Tax=Serinibacter salmoneus TaxID=556530 RepID=A0A2A9CZP1_9MICO|nr:carbohydrate ABC transporter substrate-binding protein (CUT1 family) [Serinibacter salmoneus]